VGVHALLVAATVAAAVVPAAAGWTALAEVAAEPLIVLGAPVFLLFGVYYYPGPGLSPVAGALATAAPAVLVVVAHLAVVLAVRRSRAVSASGGATRREELFVADAPMSRATVGTAVVSAALGVGVWVVWLSGWLPLSWLPVSWLAAGSSAGLVDGAHTVVQHWGYAATLAVAAAVLALRLRPVVVAAGLTAGFWVCWTVWVLGQDSALAAFASLIVLANMTPLTAVSALLGYSARPVRWARSSTAAPA
jgi:hypothetical protein